MIARPRLGRILRRLARVAAAIAVCTVTASAMALRIVVTNDDGFEHVNLQTLFTALRAAGHDVLLCAPYRDQSGSSAVLGSLTDFPRTEAPSPGGKIAAGSPGVGPTTLAADQFYLNGSPATALAYALDTLARARWSAAPDLVIVGPNAGNNLGSGTPHSGTVGAAITALHRGVPALAVSGANADPAAAPLLAAIALRIVDALTRQGKVALPPGTGLNINIPALDPARTAASYRIAFTQLVSGASTESSVFAEGHTVTVSPLQSSYQAAPETALQVLTPLRSLFASAPILTNPKLTNLSLRGYVGSGQAVQIAGFVVAGTVAKTFLLRASGPALAAFGVTDTLADPILELFDHDHRLVASNDNWGDDPAPSLVIADAAARAGAFAWPPSSKDAALVVTLPPGSYSLVIRGAGQSTGIALLETYDLAVD